MGKIIVARVNGLVTRVKRVSDSDVGKRVNDVGKRVGDVIVTIATGLVTS